MLYDTHLHTEISDDSTVKIVDYLHRAQALGIGITPTEHLDYDHPHNQGFVPDINKYFRDYSQFRGKGCYLGIEVGMQTQTAEKNRQVVEKYNFDHILCSFHILDGKDLIGNSLYQQPKLKVFHDYFRRMYENLKLHSYMTSLGHIDYISRSFCAKYPDPEIYYGEFAEEIDAVLLWLANNNKAIEINTRRFPNETAFQSLKVLLKRFAELGGKICTFGSDSHVVSALGGHFALACQLAWDCKLQPVYFVERQPVEMQP
ncbi:MAG: PHP domain-containing protein [Negativicutes bacterium]|jgi:histidinol-phosphatase (PHP family)